LYILTSLSPTGSQNPQKVKFRSELKAPPIEV
jgi:hypothetical protein